MDRAGRQLSSQAASVDALDETAIAELTGGLIDRMTRNELVRVILTAKLPTLASADFERRLPFYDCETLRRLVYRAQQCCFNRQHCVDAKELAVANAPRCWSGGESW